MRLIQSQPTPVDFTPEQHTDFIFAVSNWPAFLATVGATALALTVAVLWYRRRRRPPSEP